METLSVTQIAERAKAAGQEFKNTPSQTKNMLLSKIAQSLLKNTDFLISENRKDIQIATENGRNAAFIDRLTLNNSRIAQMASGLTTLIALPDPVGEIVESYTLPNSLRVKKVRAPLGVVGIIYEARPNVTADAAGLTLKSGNAVVLRGSREAIHSNLAIANIMREVLFLEHQNPDVVSFVDGMSRDRTMELLHAEGLVDVIIPRGGNSLKQFVQQNATMPVIASAGGNCHVYVEKTANFEMAYRILENAKVQRPSVCNAAETLLVDRQIAAEFLPFALTKLAEKQVEIRGTAEAKQFFAPLNVIDEAEFAVEYENLILKVALVDNVQQAVQFINRFGTGHSEAIVTETAEIADYFLKEVDAAAIYHNASTRFTDGYELGLGAEMGISTQKLHCRGPIGLKELTSVGYRISGNGQTRT